MLEIQVAYATQDKYKVIALCVPEGTTLEQAILLSSIQTYFPDLDLVTQRVGIFGELKERDECVKAGDRVEIYRPLNHDPILARKQRVKQDRALKRRLRQQRREEDRV
jgi:uncharacterized protein